MIDAFREKDKNLDGLMSYEEFVGHETRNELAFKALDTNGDGFVSRSEFKKICPNMTKGVVHQIVSPISNSEPKIFLANIYLLSFSSHFRNLVFGCFW